MCVVCVCVIPAWSPGIETNCWLFCPWQLANWPQMANWPNIVVIQYKSPRRRRLVMALDRVLARKWFAWAARGSGGREASQPGGRPGSQFLFQNRTAKTTGRPESREVWLMWLPTAVVCSQYDYLSQLALLFIEFSVSICFVAVFLLLFSIYIFMSELNNIQKNIFYYKIRFQH